MVVEKADQLVELSVGQTELMRAVRMDSLLAVGMVEMKDMLTAGGSVA